MGVQVILIPTEVVSHSIPFPILFYSHGIPGPIGNPIPMHISNLHHRVNKKVRQKFFLQNYKSYRQISIKLGR